MKLRRGFTLIELLVIVAVIGVLASIVLIAFNGARDKARTARTNTELKELARAMKYAANSGPLSKITANNCTGCSCRTIGDLRNLPASNSCFVLWKNAINKITLANQGIYGVASFERDPWGSPFFLDENEQEGSPTNCTHDNLRSVGPDGLFNTSDDISMSLPFNTPQCNS